ncbi:MAG: bifunctional oligoribonuclease/PAP phosphatase NrnA [Deltaproteobacteria bacterium]|nr:bifunctional oligoribonuclease/PAP phosphatase NrnA [Deltaproteobacteria bacterium]
MAAHQRPDGDALGSSLAISLALREMGKEVVHFAPDDLPYNFRFLPGVDEIASTLPEGPPFDATFVCDTPRQEALPEALWAKQGLLGTLVNIDHHRDSEAFGDLNYIDPTAAAVGVMIWRILQALGHPVSEPVAVGLYTAILTDTGSFRYDCTDPECMRVTGELIAAGVHPWEMASRIYESQPEARLRLLASALQTLEVSHAGQYATLTVFQETLRSCGATPDMLDGFVNHARSVDGVEVAALFVELPEGGFKVSFRSRGNVPLQRVGERLGGNGSRNAASALIPGELASAKALASEAVTEIIPAP